MSETKAKKTKVALVANSTWNIYNFRLNLIKKLESEKLEVIVIAPVDEYIHYLNNVANIRHIPLKTLSRKSTNPFKDIVLFNELNSIYKKEKPDLVIHYTIKPNIYGNLAASLNKIKSICAVTGLGYTFLNKGFTNFVARYLYKFSFRFSDRVVFENEDDRALFIREKLATEQKCISMKGCGVNTNYFRPLVNGRKNGKRVFLFIGRLLYDKGIVEFVEAAKLVRAKIKNTEFWVVGELDSGNPSAIDKEQLVKWVNEKDIHYCGTTKDIRGYMKQTDVVVLPSYREGLPKVILEGMAMGKPIVTTDTAGCRETVEENENGYLVPVKDADQLAKAMMKMALLSNEELEEMGNASREKTLEIFDDKIIANQFMEIIDEILETESSTELSTIEEALILE